MSYYVSLGGINITAVKDVSLTSGRDTDVYEGIGNGNFSVPRSENLREWTISCQLTTKNEHNLDHWQAAGYIFTSFESMLKTKDYSRFIVASDSGNISELVYLKQYTKKEEYSGVYDVEITVQEYKAVAIKTTGVPYIARPGKVPVPPKVTITKKNTAYSTIKKLTGASPAANIPGKSSLSSNKNTVHFVDPKTGKPITNPVLVKEGGRLVLKETPKPQTWNVVTPITIATSVGQAFTSIGEAIEAFKRKAANLNAGGGGGAGNGSGGVR